MMRGRRTKRVLENHQGAIRHLASRIDNITTYMRHQKHICCDELGNDILVGRVVWHGQQPWNSNATSHEGWWLKTQWDQVPLAHCPYCGAKLPNLADGESNEVLR